MNDLRELLRDADPLRQEPERPLSRRALDRQAVLAAARLSHAPARERRRSRGAVFAVSAAMVISAVVLGTILWPGLNTHVLAAIQFEARIAETKPAPGLQKAKVEGAHAYFYLHKKVVVNNNDIAAVHVIRGRGPSQYAISIKFTPAGAEKMRQATQDSAGKRLAILLDGKIVTAPVIRGSVGEAAEITGSFTRAEAEELAKRITKGIGIQ